MNGMEVPSSAGGTDASGGTNRGRPFDFNVFGAELFSKINIHKSAIASVEEGGVASTVELFSHKPLDSPGLTVAGSANTAYNVNTGEVSPRLSGLVANSFMDDKLGVLAGFNYSKRDVRQDGFGSVRWTSPVEDGAEYIEPAGGTQVNGALADGYTINDLFTPRLPRMDLFNRETERLGFALGLQYRPTDELEMGLNILNSSFDQDTTSLNYFAQFRSNFDSITANEITPSSNGRYVVGGSFDNVSPRSESRIQTGSSEFQQVVADFSYDFSDTLHLTGLFGNANTTYQEDYFRSNYDVNAASTFDFNMTNGGNLAEMSYGFDITDYTQYNYRDSRIQRDDLERDYNTFRLDLVWDLDDNGSNVKTGLIMNQRTITSDFYRTDIKNENLIADGNGLDLDADNTNTVGDAYGDFGDGIDAPSGFPRSWVIADFKQLDADLGRPEPEFLETNSNTYEVTEDTTGFYGEVNYIWGNLLANAGLRYVETEVTSGGYILGSDGEPVYNELEGSYSNTLPALNLTYNITDDLRGRFSWAENVARPNPASLSGAVSVSGVNGEITANNPSLKPEIAESMDLAVEWFFAEESYVGLTYFQKEISDAIDSDSFDYTGVPPEYRAVVDAHPDYQPPVDASVKDRDSDPWILNTKVNSTELTEIDGWEIGYQQMFQYGVGVLANYTSVDSGDQVIDGLSETTTNLGVFWENDTFGARLMMNSRDDYVTREPGRNGNLAEKTTGPTRFDLSSHWNATEMITVTFEVINLTNEKERIYTNGPMGDLDLVREYNTTGIEAILGVRASF